MVIHTERRLTVGQLAERVRTAAERVTGFPARVSARGLEIPVESEQQLEELAEALEAVST